MIKIKSNKIVLLDSLFDGYIYIEDGKIIEVSKENKPADKEYDYTGSFVSPGFIEIHTHGGGGYPFINNTVDDVINACNFHLKHGTTTILPTVTAGPFEVMKKATLNVVEALKTGKIKSNVPGVHLEGPYLSKDQAGAQCPDFITPPIKEEYVPFVEEYGKYIKKWTYAPENDKNGEFAKFISSHNIIPSIGHSNAIYDDVLTAVNNGATMVTHLYSCTSTITRDHGFRRLGVIESAYLLDDLTCEIIADGKHLPLDLIKLILKCKGIEKTVLVTDSLEIAGTDIKEGLMS
ncbi:MAG: amidohydrolase family protein, partial [Bacilli bacterium]|nr:amidohydrolase family protein [Bacilli bacterium]